MLPSPFPKLLLWSSAGGVTPQAEKRWPVPRRGWRTAQLALLRHKKRPVTTTGRFCIGRVGDRAGRVSSTVYHGVHLGQSGGLRPKGQEEDCGTPLLPAKRAQTRGARSGTDRAPLVWRSFIRRRGPACRSEEKVLEGRGKGRPGAARRAVPVTTKEVTGIESWLEGGPFPRKGVPPLSFPFESDVTTYSCARPMPGRAASRPAPRRKRPASSKALPMSCMPTGILLSAAMPTGRDRPGRPARFRDRV